VAVLTVVMAVLLVAVTVITVVPPTLVVRLLMTVAGPFLWPPAERGAEVLIARAGTLAPSNS
jgi:hypothetical protein